MLICMRTTLNLEDAIMRAVKRQALETGRTMTQVIEDSLRETLIRKKRSDKREFKLQMVTVKGTKKPGVDLTDRCSLYDIMESRS